MLRLRAMGGENEVVAMLVLESDYVHHINEVVGVTTSELLYLKRKFASTAGYELTRYPLEDCKSVTYSDDRSILSIISGVLVTMVVGLAIAGLVYSWSDLDAGTRVPIGGLAVAGLYGIRRIFGARQHSLFFTLKDGTQLWWTSSAGEFEQWKPSAELVVAFIRKRGLMEVNSDRFNLIT